MAARISLSTSTLALVKSVFAVAVVVFAVAVKGQASEKTLLTFNQSNGSVPNGSLVSDAQGNLYGTTSFGGANPCSCGVVFKLTPSSDGGWTESILYTFKGGSDGAEPTAGIIFDAAGNIYGTTVYGGHSSYCPGSKDVLGCGTVFRLKPDSSGTWEESVLYRFKGGQDGGNPATALVMDSHGNLYGTTSCQDAPGCIDGTVFKLAPASGVPWKETVLHNFTHSDQDGSAPYGTLVMDAAGNLYGTTSQGGPGYEGTVFEVSPLADGAWTYTRVFSFGLPPAVGYHPFGGVIVDATGTNLYGMTFGGGYPCHDTGGSGCGIVFRLKRDSSGNWTERVLHLFRGSDGANPFDSLVFDSKGNLYGTTFYGGRSANCYGGCGAVFKLSRSVTGVWTEDLLFSFDATDGMNPQAGVLRDESGNLFGTTTTGGGVFEVTAP